MHAKLDADPVNPQIAPAIEALGAPGFFAALDAYLSALVKNDYPQFWLFRHGEAPMSLYHTLRGKMRALHVDGYIKGAYQGDPVYRKSLELDEPDLVRITEIAAKRFRQTEYFRRYHSATGNIDEVTFIIQVEDGSVIHLPIMRVQGSGRFSPDEIDTLRNAEPVVRSLVRKHWALMSSASEAAMPASTASGQAIDHFGSSLLSPREQAVVRLLLMGHSAKSGAARLGISPETFARHRKTIYRKLDIGSISELFSLFIGSLPCFEQASDRDPLEIYLQTPKAKP